MSAHDVGELRELGLYWEQKFCELAQQRGFMHAPLQIGKKDGAALAYQGQDGQRRTLPDVVVLTSPSQYHEVKHKNPTRFNTYGFEQYRLEALLALAHETDLDVMYTIHDHELAGGRNAKTNHIEHWKTANVLNLDGQWSWSCEGESLVDGIYKRVLMYYWPCSLWMPLLDYWNGIAHTLYPRLESEFDGRKTWPIAMV